MVTDPNFKSMITPPAVQLTEQQILDMQEESSRVDQEYDALQEALNFAEHDMEDIPQYTHEEVEAYAAQRTQDAARETIIRVLMGSYNGKDILARVAEIQAGLWVAPFVPTHVKTGASEKRRAVVDGKGWENIMVRVLDTNPYSMDAPYLIEYPNGETDWVKGS